MFLSLEVSTYFLVYKHMSCWGFWRLLCKQKVRWLVCQICLFNLFFKAVRALKNPLVWFRIATRTDSTLHEGAAEIGEFPGPCGFA